ncbi:MCE family protein [Candidatus Desantisbacteria bacterium]|nr:MCE family protein [Candidatus Desantisbacteria bacterium]
MIKETAMHQELKIGIVVAAAIIIAGIMITMAGGRSFYRQGYQIRVPFDYISGLAIGAPVRLAGMEIGEVRNLRLIGNQIEATIWVESSARIRSDSRITINSLGIVGEKYIEITLDFIIGENPVNMEELLVRSEKMVKMLDYQVKFLDRLMFSGKINWDEISAIIHNTAEITEETNKLLKNNKGDISSGIHSFNRLSTTLEKTVNENRAELQCVTGELKKATKNLNVAILNTDKGINKCLADFTQSASSFSNFCKKIDEGNGSLGMIIKDKKIANDLSETANNLKLLSEDLRQNPWKLVNLKGEKQSKK